MVSTKEKDVPFAFDKLTLGLKKSLEERTGICDVKFDQLSPVNKHQITHWEQKYVCNLPEDLKNFYLTCNGLKLHWSSKIKDVRIPVGSMEINSIENLTIINKLAGSPVHKNSTSLPPCVQDLDDDEADDEQGQIPKFDHRSRIFEMDPCDGYGKVCLVYNNTKQGVPASNCEIWFMDRALDWHKMTSDFTSYYRLMLLHLGLPQWQYNFTNIGLSLASKQWYHMYAPSQLQVTGEQHKESIKNAREITAPSLDIGRVFKGKSDKKKNVPSNQVNKKRHGQSLAAK